GYPEEDIGYGTAVVAGLAQLIEPLRRAGLYDAYADCPRYAKFGEAILHFVQPWGRYLTNTGDHSDCIICRETVLARQAEEARNPSILWLLGRLIYPTTLPLPGDTSPPTTVEIPLHKGFQIPATGWSLLLAPTLKKIGAARPSPATMPTAFRDRTRGIVSFRSGWDDDATFVVFDGSQRSPACQGHMHASGGHFDLSALGEYFATDTGRYNIEQNCHNVVLVDGKSGRSTDGQWVNTTWHGLLTDYQPGAFCDTAAADSSYQHACFWARRRVGLVKGRGAPAYAWTLEDINKANDWAEFWWQLHTSPENTIALDGQTATITGWRHGHQLDVHFVLPPPNAYPKAHTLRLDQDEATPSSYRYVPNPREEVARRFARPAEQVHGPGYVRPRLLAKVGGYNGRFMALMLPRRKGEPRATVEALPTRDNAFAARLTFGGVEDTLICAYEHHLLEADGIHGGGDWCVVRRDRKTRRVLQYELGDGTSVTVDGKTLPGV
ncbi:MAG: heparinase II/III family protein, partial [Lentisphaerae bacterium]|nr:heparinase II/III family protein [Lentisphaerota bacterium]